jgi:hypothetical protein
VSQEQGLPCSTVTAYCHPGCPWDLLVHPQISQVASSLLVLPDCLQVTIVEIFSSSFSLPLTFP